MNRSQISELKKLVADSKIDEALSSITEKYIHFLDKKQQNRLVIQRKRHNELKSQIINGLIDNKEAMLISNQITFSVLEIIDSMKLEIDKEDKIPIEFEKDIYFDFYTIKHSGNKRYSNSDFFIVEDTTYKKFVGFHNQNLEIARNESDMGADIVFDIKQALSEASRYNDYIVSGIVEILNSEYIDNFYIESVVENFVRFAKAKQIELFCRTTLNSNYEARIFAEEKLALFDFRREKNLPNVLSRRHMSNNYSFAKVLVNSQHGELYNLFFPTADYQFDSTDKKDLYYSFLLSQIIFENFRLDKTPRIWKYDDIWNVRTQKDKKYII